MLRTTSIFGKGFWPRGGCSTCSGGSHSATHHIARALAESSFGERGKWEIRIDAVKFPHNAHTMPRVSQLCKPFEVLAFRWPRRFMPKRADGWAIRASISGSPPSCCWFDVDLPAWPFVQPVHIVFRKPLWHPATAIRSKLVGWRYIPFSGCHDGSLLGEDTLEGESTKGATHEFRSYKMYSLACLIQPNQIWSDDNCLEVLISLVWDWEFNFNKLHTQQLEFRSKDIKRSYSFDLKSPNPLISYR